MGVTGRGSAVGVALALLSAAAFAVGPVGAKAAFADGSNVLTVVTLRGAVAAALAAALIAATGGSFRLDRRAWGPSLLGGAFQSGVVYSLLAAVAFVPVGAALLLFFTHPILIAGIEHLRGGERLGARKAFAALMVAAGLALVLLPGAEVLDPRGLGLAALASLAMCGVILSAARAQAHAGSAQVNLVSTAAAGSAFAVLTTASGGWAMPGGVEGWSGILAAGLGIGVGLLAFLAALRRIGAVRASMLGTVEPLAGAALAAAVLGERLAGVQWAGAVVVVLALIAFEARAGRGAAREPGSA